MKIYDTHSDIFDNLYRKALKGEKDPFKQYHLDALKKGKIVGGIWVIYSDSNFDILKAYEYALNCFLPYSNQFDVIYGLEGLRNVFDLQTLEKLYHMNVRHASLTWNEANHLAGGVKGPVTQGLTDLGREFLAFMKEKRMIVDVSHLNEKSFYDVLETKPQLLIASHSNSYSLCNHPRNLTDEQLLALKEANGMIGAVSVRSFVSRMPEEQNIKGFIKQIKYLVSIMGSDRVMLGLDMMDFLPDFQNSNLDDLTSHRDAQKIVQAMVDSGLNEEDIKKICYQNFLTLKRKMEE